MENILTVENLSKNLDDFSLKDISFKLPKGSIMGLVGENGAGKTSLIKSILNIYLRDQGKVHIFEQEFRGDMVELKDDIGLVLDGNFFHDNLNPRDIDLILKNLYSNWRSETYYAYLEKFKLPRDKKIKNYSKGMVMKLSLATALSHRARLLILDEPTSGLDPIVRLEILDELLDFIQDPENSVLFSSHITSDLDKIADYISLIHDGELIFSKDREELLTNYGIVKNRLEDIPADIGLRVMTNNFSSQVLVSNRFLLDDSFIVDKATIEDIMLFFIKGGKYEGPNN